MPTAVEIVQGLTDAQAVKLVTRLNQTIFSVLPFDEVQAHLPSGSREVDMLAATDIEVKKRKLDPQSSVKTARQVLIGFARDPDLAPLILDSWDEVKEDDTLFVGEIIAVGLVVNLVLLLATTEIEFKKGKLTIREKAADQGILKELMSPITELLKRFTSG